MKEFLKRLDFKFYWVSILPLLFILLTYPAMKWLAIEYCYENSLLENFQLIILLSTFVVCLKTRTDKKFFYSLAFVCLILFLREINCGRTIFFPVPGIENTFYSWKDIKYGWLAHPIYGAFMTGSALYFIITKSYKVLVKYFLHAKLSVYNWLFLFWGIFFGLLGESIGNFQLEEMSETTFYLALFALIYLQAFHKNYIETTDKK